MTSPGDIVTAVIAGTEVVGRITDTLQEADYASGPRTLYRVDVPGRGTYRVPEADIGT